MQFHNREYRKHCHRANGSTLSASNFMTLRDPTAVGIERYCKRRTRKIIGRQNCRFDFTKTGLRCDGRGAYLLFEIVSDQKRKRDFRLKPNIRKTSRCPYCAFGFHCKFRGMRSLKLCHSCHSCQIMSFISNHDHSC
jgi:hypothetical protein